MRLRPAATTNGPMTKAVVMSKLEKTPSGSTGSTYTDGHPLHQIHYLEAKLILKPDRFTSVESFRDFGRIVKRAAKETDVKFIAEPEGGQRPDIREILFLDTPDFRLHNNAFILRRRISYVDGFPVGDPEIVFKYRHSDEKTAAAVDVRPNIAGKYRIKFKAEALPLKDQIGSYRVLYSHNCQFGLSQVHAADRTSMLTLTRVFPALGVLKQSPDEKVSLVAKPSWKRCSSSSANWTSAKNKLASAMSPCGELLVISHWWESSHFK